MGLDTKRALRAARWGAGIPLLAFALFCGWEASQVAQKAAAELAMVAGSSAASAEASKSCAPKSANPSIQDFEDAVECMISWKASGAATPEAREAIEKAKPFWASSDFERVGYEAYEQASQVDTPAGQLAILSLIRQWGVSAVDSGSQPQAERAKILAQSLRIQMRISYDKERSRIREIEEQAPVAMSLARAMAPQGASSPLSAAAQERRRKVLAEYWQTQRPELLAQAARAVAAGGESALEGLEAQARAWAFEESYRPSDEARPLNP